MKKLLTLLLSCVMVFTMSVSAFADTGANSIQSKTNGNNYFAISDSIGTGFAITWGPEVDIQKLIELDLKEANIPDIPWQRFNESSEVGYNDLCGPGFKHESFVKDVYESYNGEYDFDNVNGYNLSYPAVRAKDVCYMMEIIDSGEEFRLGQNLTPQDKEYADFMNHGFFGVLDSKCLERFRANNKTITEKKLKQADIITIQLGLNDFTSAMIDDKEAISQSITDTMTGINNLGKIPDELKNFINKIPEERNPIKKAWMYAIALTALNVKLGQDIFDSTAIIRQFDKSMTNATNNSITYMQQLVSRIYQLNPNATVVIVNEYNPFATIGDTIVGLGDLIDSELAAKAINDIAAALIQPYVNKVNKAYQNIADTYGYEVADITNIAPHPAKLFHPDSVGHARIAQYIEQAIQRAWTAGKNEREDGITGVQSSAGRYDRCSCGGDEYITQYTVAPTYLTAGKAQDYCAVCKNKLGKEYVVARFNLAKVKNVTGKVGSKKATVKYGVVKGATGYQVYCKQSGKSAKKYKTTALSKTIKNLKSGKKYTFKVRAYVTGNGKTYYGNWSKNVTKKIK